MTLQTPHGFPHDPALVGLLHAARTRSDAGVLIHDICGYEKSLPQLLGDVLKTTQRLRMQLPLSALDGRGILRQEAPYVAVLTRSGYDFLVAFFAVRAVGGACVPLGHSILPEEAHYFLSRTNTTCVLVAADGTESAARIATYVNEHGGTCCTVPISLDSEPAQTSGVEIDEAIQLSPDSPGLVLFTSGTTGRPKGVILRRACFTRTKLAAPGKAAVNYYPAHWIGGARTLIISVLTGKHVYAHGESGSAKAVLQTLKNHRITHLNFSTRLLGQMKQLLSDDKTGRVPQEKQEEYARFWIDLTGLPLRFIYTGTEMGSPIIMTREDPQTTGLIGTPLRNVHIKLSEGSRGGILVKSPLMLLGYAGDEEATRAAFDEEGFYKTGDIAELKDGQYYFVGRESSDFCLFSVYRIPLQEVEQCLADLPYVSEACALALPDHEARGLCAAIIRVARAAGNTDKINLTQVRSDLGESLPSFMLPVILRILKDDEEIPRTVSGKPIKKAIRKDYFATTDWWPHNNPPAEVEYCGNVPLTNEADKRPWNWAGVQRV